MQIYHNYTPTNFTTACIKPLEGAEQSKEVYSSATSSPFINHRPNGIPKLSFEGEEERTSTHLSIISSPSKMAEQ